MKANPKAVRMTYLINCLHALFGYGLAGVCIWALVQAYSLGQWGRLVATGLVAVIVAVVTTCLIVRHAHHRHLYKEGRYH
jgi:hypothetical protein